MAWIINDIKKALAQLRRGQTWLAIGLISLFAFLAYVVSQFAFRTDSVLMFLRHTASSCREMTNGIIIFLFCGMIFFLFTAVLTLGELQRYFDLKQRSAHYQARQTLYWGLGWGAVAIGIAVAALVFFNTYCR
ncbi:hypothetical protein [Dechloromonas sp. A34]|uniref:hypothetical protein n=1 Tax=Dechloromonas sp. A34 TaxID=447588 RepID=UPI00224998D7|nr:hypothetical protein [Dechloromonas sp. A34]